MSVETASTPELCSQEIHFFSESALPRLSAQPPADEPMAEAAIVVDEARLAESLDQVVRSLRALAKTDLTLQQRRYLQRARQEADACGRQLRGALLGEALDPQVASRVVAGVGTSVVSKSLHGISSDTASVGNSECPFRLQPLIDSCAEDALFFGASLHKFGRRAGDLLAALHRALAAGNMTQLANQAHTFASLADDFCATELAGCAATLARTIASGDEAAIRRQVERLGAEVVRCVAAIPRVCQQVHAQARTGQA